MVGSVTTAEQVARVLHCSRRRGYDLARRDELPSVRHLGRTLIVVRPVFETWLLTGRRPAATLLVLRSAHTQAHHPIGVVTATDDQAQGSRRTSVPRPA